MSFDPNAIGNRILLCVQMRSYRRKNLLKNLVFPIATSAILKGEAPMAL